MIDRCLAMLDKFSYSFCNTRLSPVKYKQSQYKLRTHFTGNKGAEFEAFQQHDVWTICSVDSVSFVLRMRMFSERPGTF